MIMPLLLLAVLLPGAPAAPQALHPLCADAPTPVLFAQWDTQLENLAFDGAGGLYVSDLGGDRLLLANRSGALSVVDEVAGMHGMAFGPDGHLFVGATSHDGTPGVWRYSTTPPTAGARVEVASGLQAANGMAFDAAGNLFVSSPLSTQGPYLVKLPADDMAAWQPWTDTYGPNGLVLMADGGLLAAITADQSSPLMRFSTSAPDAPSTVAELSFGAATLQPGVHAPSGPLTVVPKGLDDLTIAPDGFAYATAHVTGELLRVDLATGDACAWANGFEEPTSVRVANGFDTWAGYLFVTDMGGVGVTALAGPGAGAIWAVPLA